MEKLNNCPVCGSENFTTHLTCTDYVASGENFEIVKCNNCTLQFTNPRPEESEIGKYYKSDKYISHTGNNKSELGVTYKIYDLVRNFSIQSKLQLIKSYNPTGHLLDLGCGLGYFLNGVKLDKTYSYLGADVSEEAIQYVKNQFDIEVINENTLNSISSNSIDIITQWHVLEHVYKLQERVQFLKRVLKKDGTMFIAVPISESFDAEYYKKYWDGYDVPRHIYHFTRESFIKLMEQNGFKVVKQKAMIFDAPYISMRSEYHQKNKMGFIKGGFTGMLSNLIALFKGNYSSILFVVKHA